ncbi:UNVERIFIED_CONTAM: hypothetical protein FKN15_052876, partial [Acipenser sinensis]
GHALPGVAEGSASPGVDEGSASPGVAEGAASPGVAEGSASPGVAEGSASPGVAEGSASPGVAEGSALLGVAASSALLGVAAGSASPGVAEGSASPGVAAGSASPGVAASPSWQQGILWPEPQRRELLATKKGGEVRRPLPPQSQPPPLCHSPVPGGWIPRPGLPDTQAPCLDLWLLGLTPRSWHHQAQEVAWSPAPLPLVAQTLLHGCLGLHLCLGLQPTGRLPVLPTPHSQHLGPLSPGLSPAKRASSYGLTLPQQWEKEDLPPWPSPWTTCFPSSGTLRLRGEVAIGAMCALHKGGYVAGW